MSFYTDIDKLLAPPVDREIVPREPDEEEDDFELHDDSISKPFKKGKRQRTPRTKGPLEIDPNWLLPFEKGWRREIVQRGTPAETTPTGKQKPPAADVYYFAPEGKKLRSRPEIERHLEKTGSTLSIESFTFVKDMIHEPPMEVVRLAGDKGRTSFGSPRAKAPEPKPIDTKPRDEPVDKPKPKIKKDKPFKYKPSFEDPKRSKSESRDSSERESSKKHEKSHSSSSKDFSSKKDGSSHKDGSSYKKHDSSSSRKDSSSHKEHSSSSRKESSSSSHKESNNSHKESSSSKKESSSSSKESSSSKKEPSNYKESSSSFLSEFSSTSKSESASSEKKPSSSSSSSKSDAPAPLAVKRAAVAKKHTSSLKRRKLNPEGSDSNRSSPISTQSRSPSPPTPEKKCGLDCKGREGAPPTLQCSTCMCMYHPECMKLDPSVMEKMINYKCLGCRAAKANGNTSAPAAPTGSSKQPSPPQPAQMEPERIQLPQMNPNALTGQLLTLPAKVAKNLKMNESLSLKVQGKNFVVPPSCFVHTPDGVKVLLPQGSLPEKAAPTSSLPAPDVRKDTTSTGKQQLAVKDPVPAAPAPTASSPSSSSISSHSSVKSSVDLIQASERWGNKRRQKKKNAITSELCFIQKLHGGHDCMIQIFQYLSIPELLNASKVCSTWNAVAQHATLWKNVWLGRLLVTDWEMCIEALQYRKTRSLDLRGMEIAADADQAWQQFTSRLDQLTRLEKITFDRCPGSVIQAAAEKLKNLKHVRADLIVESLSEPNKCEAKVDMGKFSKCTDLQYLNLRGVVGLTLPTYCFSGGLSELANLTNLACLSLTTLHNVPEQEFTFLDSLTNLIALEIGDCTSWSKDTFARLGKLHKLTTLRMECGGLLDDAALVESLCNMKHLQNLELVKWKTGNSTAADLSKLEQLMTLCIWPMADSVPETAKINSNTFKAAVGMPSLRSMEWGVITTREVTEDTPSDGDYQVPFMELDGVIEGSPDSPQYVQMQVLRDTLHTRLHHSKIRLFKVPSFL